MTLDRRGRLRVLVICCVGVLLTGIDGTIVNVALPTIRRDFHAPLSGLQWTVDAYALVLASLMLLSGSMADRFGRRRMFLFGLMVFTAGSALCAAAPSLDVLIGARALQAVGGATLTPLALSIIRTTFDDSRERARAIGTWGAMSGVAMATGPVLGGVLVDGPGWRCVFLVNLPIGVITIVAAARVIPESRAGDRRPVDGIGQLLVITMLVCLTFALIEGGRLGWTSAAIVACFTAGVLSLLALIPWELRRAAPLLDLRLFRSVPFSAATLIAACMFASVGGFMLLTQLYLQSARGLSALQAGLFSVPMALSTIVLAPLAGRIVADHGSRWLLVCGGIFRIAPPVLFLGLSLHTPIWLIAVAFFLNGAGMGLLNTPLSATAIAGVPPAQAGVAGAITSTARQIGFVVGVALVGVVLGSDSSQLSGSRLARATHAGWLTMIGIGALISVIGGLATTRWALRTALDPADGPAGRGDANTPCDLPQSPIGIAGAVKQN
jgi:EmrB/QacA subfamily drug resistance transporter